MAIGKGRQHDFAVFKDSRLLLHPKTPLLGDSGYLGIHKYHQNTSLPIKKKKGQPLSAKDKAHNKELSKQRIFIEHVNRRCKIFRIVKEIYRGKHKNYSLTWHTSPLSCVALCLYLGKMSINAGTEIILALIIKPHANLKPLFFIAKQTIEKITAII